MADPELQVVSNHIVGPMEASFVAQGNQRRIDLAEPVIELLAGLRAQINLLDNTLEREAALLKSAWAEVKEKGWSKYETEFSNRTYWLTMLGLMAVETPLNAASLDFARLPVWEGWRVAFGFALLNFFGAKTAGRVLRQAKGGIADWRHWFAAFAVTSVLGMALTQFAGLRQMDPELGGSAGAFLALQACFFVIVAAVTFFHLDPEPGREQQHRRIERGQMVLETNWKRRVSLAKAYNAKRAKIELRMASTEEDTHARVAQYRTGNLRERKDMPAFMTQALPRGVFTPVVLPAFIDEEPLQIREMIGLSSKAGAQGDGSQNGRAEQSE